ncbi:hypothetical protein MAUB_28730 [Mycolicibacterium aubagnense]|uniref:Uncharacterized protein n=1 Tax=Mycolicibacterium aubagnense TaxID=319707 RepID=A0ABM7IE98_9MYCO|nr:hypothetical protein MAUB_28730 [Mycolicibacterium aubagnense]
MSGQVRSNGGTVTEPDAGLPPGTSSAKLRYRLTGIAELRWVFQDGWPSRRGPDGVVMARTDEKESAEESGE